MLTFWKKLAITVSGIAIAALLLFLSPLRDSVVSLGGYLSPQSPQPINLNSGYLLTSEVYHPMKVRFRQSGGFAGLRRGCDLDMETLPADEATKLRSLVEQSGVLSASSSRNPKGRDLLNYEITVETLDGVRQVTFDDGSKPVGVEPLLEYLQGQAQPIPLR
jgi:hypothetical protein